jgi:hypothetical protein
VKSIHIILVLSAAAGQLIAQQRYIPQVPRVSGAKPSLELRITAGEMENGLPKRFTFVFVNISDHALRMPSPPQCGSSAGTVSLRSHFTPLSAQGVHSGGAGGCGSDSGWGRRGIVEWARSWPSLKLGESLAVSYSRRDLFNFQEDAGTYEFWGEYSPPRLTVDEVSDLVTAGFDFPRTILRSPHLVCNRP